MIFRGGYLDGKEVPEYVKKLDGYAYEVPYSSDAGEIIHHNYMKSTALFNNKTKQWLDKCDISEHPDSKYITKEDIYEFYEESKMIKK